MPRETKWSTPDMILAACGILVTVVIGVWNAYTWYEGKTFRDSAATASAEAAAARQTREELINFPVLRPLADGEIKAVNAEIVELYGMDYLGVVILAHLKFDIENLGGRSDRLNNISAEPALAKFTRVEGDSEETVEMALVLGDGIMIISGFGTNTEVFESKPIAVPEGEMTTVFASVVICEMLEIDDTLRSAEDPRPQQPASVPELFATIDRYGFLTIPFTLKFLQKEDVPTEVRLALAPVHELKEETEVPIDGTACDISDAGQDN